MTTPLLPDHLPATGSRFFSTGLCLSVLFLVSILLSPLSASGIPGYECIDISESASGGPEPQSKTVDLKSGGPVVLNLSFQLYSIPDTVRVTLLGAGSPNSVIYDNTRNGTFDVPVEVAAGRNRSLRIEMNPQGGLDGTAWDWSLKDTAANEIVLADFPPSVAHDKAEFISDLRRGEVTVAKEDFIKKISQPEASAIVRVPGGAKALRIKVDGGYAVYVAKGCPPAPSDTTVIEKVSNPEGLDNWIIIPNPQEGKYGITLKALTNPTTVKVFADVVMGGTWAKATGPFASGRTTRGTENSLAGFEWDNGLSGNLSVSPLWFVAHGNDDNPMSMITTGFGLASYCQLNRHSNIVYANWSQGAGVLQFEGKIPTARQVPAVAQALLSLLPNKKVSAASHNWAGHSFGTWLGFEMTRSGGGPFGRFVALDPANTAAAGYPGRTINFQTASADGAVAIVATWTGLFGGNPPISTFGSESLARTALVTLAMDINVGNSLEAARKAVHRAPQRLFELMLNNGIGFGADALTASIFPARGNPASIFASRLNSFWRNNPAWNTSSYANSCQAEFLYEGTSNLDTNHQINRVSYYLRNGSTRPGFPTVLSR